MGNITEKLKQTSMDAISEKKNILMIKNCDKNCLGGKIAFSLRTKRKENEANVSFFLCVTVRAIVTSRKIFFMQ
jgi:hypothetical protein